MTGPRRSTDRYKISTDKEWVGNTTAHSQSCSPLVHLSPCLKKALVFNIPSGFVMSLSKMFYLIILLSTFNVFAKF